MEKEIEAPDVVGLLCLQGKMLSSTDVPSSCHDLKQAFRVWFSQQERPRRLFAPALGLPQDEVKQYRPSATPPGACALAGCHLRVRLKKAVVRDRSCAFQVELAGKRCGAPR